MKRLVSITLVLIFVMACVTGCGDKDKTVAQTTAVKEAVASTADTSEQSTAQTDETTALSDAEATVRGDLENSSTTRKGASTAGKATEYNCAFEIDTKKVKSVMEGAVVERAWRTSSSTTSVELHKVTYGPKKDVQVGYNFNGEEVKANDKLKETCYVAVVTTTAPQNVKCKSARQVCGKDEELINTLAKDVGALIAINDEEYSGHWDQGDTAAYYYSPVVKDGARMNNVIENPGSTCYGIYKNGLWDRNTYVTDANVNNCISNGLSFTLWSNPIIWDGAKDPFFYPIEIKDETLRNRTMFAQIDETHYIMAVGEYMSKTNMTDILIAYGAQRAFILNGGNCSYMYVKGIGNVTGSSEDKLKNLDKVNMLEQEYAGKRGLLGTVKNKGPKRGAPCPVADFIYFK